MIEPDSTLSIRRQCQLLSVNRNRLSPPPSKLGEDDAGLCRHIDAIHLEDLAFGARKIRDALRRKLPREGPRRPVRVWTADEGRFGLHPCHRRAWTMRGVRAHRDSSRRYQWSHVWAALQVGGGGSEFLYSGSVDKEVCACFLRQISERDPLAVHVVVWDGAGFHPGEDDALVPENVVLLRLPPYSPELNPVEKLWDMLRDELCNRIWKGLDELMAAATRWLEGFWSDGRRVLSLVGGGWLLVQANACSGSCLGNEL